MKRVEEWRSEHPVGYSVASLLVFLVAGAVVSLALGGGVPWFGLAVAVVVWVLVSFVLGRRGSRSSRVG